MWESAGIAFCALLGLLGTIYVFVFVLPKARPTCALPMPALPSYLFGHALAFLDVSRVVRQHLAWFAELGEVFQIWVLHRRVVVTAHPADVAQILGHAGTFARPLAQTVPFEDLAPNNFQTMPRALHRAQRALLRDVFAPKALRAMHAAVARVADDAAARLRAAAAAAPARAVDLTPHLADAAFRVLLEAALGSAMDRADRAAFAGAARGLLGELFAEYFTFPLRRALWWTGVRRRLFTLNARCRGFAARLLADRAAEPAGARKRRRADLLDVIRALAPGDAAQQTGTAAMFAIAGFESSSEALAWAVFEVAAAGPQVLRAIRAELDAVVGARAIAFEDVARLPFLAAVWKETLRLHPAAGLLLRRAERDVTLRGTRVFIPRGTQVGALIAGAQRHPDYVVRGGEFLPERWTTPVRGVRASGAVFVPFSCGPERCPGQRLANHEGVVVLAALFRSLDITLACRPDQVVPVSDWTERARAPDPHGGSDKLSWTVPVLVRPRGE